MLSKSDQSKLVESQILIAQSLTGINENLRKLNDQNVLHHEEMLCTKAEHKTMIDMLKEMTSKYWWLILVLIGINLAITGYPTLSKFFLGA